MSNQSADDFKFGTDQENPDELLQVAPEDKRIAKLSRRITILAIIMPCLIGVALFFLYLDLKGRVIQNQTSGNQSVADLSRDFADQLNALAEKIKQLETANSENITAANERFDGLKKQITTFDSKLKKVSSNLKKTNDSLKKIDTAKAGRKDLESVENKLSALSSQLSTQDESVDKKMETFSNETEKISNEISSFRQEIGEFSTVMESKIDRRTLLFELDKQQQKMTVFSGDIEKKIITIRSDLRRLDKELQQAQRSLRRLETPAAQSSSTPGQAQPGTDKIIEQNLE
jgi:chromosome segregation ATPase